MTKAPLTVIAGLIAFSATAQILPYPFAPAEIKFTALTNGPGFIETDKTNQTATSTNVITIDTVRPVRTSFGEADLLALLTNSCNTNFPAGSRIGIGWSFFVVLDSATNVIYVPTNVFSYVDGSQFPTALLERVNDSSDSEHGYMNTAAAVTFTYDDTALSPADGTHTRFIFKGLMEQRSIEKVGLRLNTTFEYQGMGDGTVRDVPTILTGRMKGQISYIYPPGPH